jgi:lipopolysaccharide/colanic/teichoic acid biosynthesis glycosyltransferase
MVDADKPRGIYLSGGKRMVDVVAGLIGLVVLVPLFILLSLILKLTSSGPIFYRQRRVGKDGRIFQIAKFRTMDVDADVSGPGITVRGDPRITLFGRIIRALKLDELPQLWNVLKGDMSLIGPRPELPEYVRNYNEEQRKVLDVCPGMTDVASIAYRYEEELLLAQENPELYYREIVLPHKLLLNAEYIRRMSLKYDLFLLAKTLSSLFLDRLNINPQ